RGSLTKDFEIYTETRAPGVVDVDMARIEPLTAGTGSLLVLQMRVKPSVQGSIAVDLQSASLNDGRLLLTPEPQVGVDPADGGIAISNTLPPLGPLPSRATRATEREEGTPEDHQIDLSLAFSDTALNDGGTVNPGWQNGRDWREEFVSDLGLRDDSFGGW